jgi:hypothetical protein
MSCSLRLSPKQAPRAGGGSNSALPKARPAGDGPAMPPVLRRLSAVLPIIFATLALAAAGPAPMTDPNA